MRNAVIRITVLLVLGLPVLAKASSTTYQQLIEDLETLRAENGVAGFALTLASASGVQTTAAGLPDLDSGRPVTADTLFRIGSITKTFNALAVMLLVEQGCLELDAPLREIVADVQLQNPWADTAPVRVAHLLEHSSGLLDITREEFDHNEPRFRS